VIHAPPLGSLEAKGVDDAFMLFLQPGQHGWGIHAF